MKRDECDMGGLRVRECTDESRSDNAGHQTWIYQVRGLAIIAVVICHQQYILHTSELVQLLTLYSVTTLVFLMGYTASLSYKKQLSCEGWDLRKYMCKLVPVIGEYVVATIVYANLFGEHEGNCSNSMLVQYLLDFSAAQLFYFIQYYISLALLFPLMIYLVKKVLTIRIINRIRWIILASVLGVVGAVGYWMWGTFLYWGGSYLFVYFFGVIMGYVDMRNLNKYVIGEAGVVICLFGFYSSSVFYRNLVQGIYTPSGIDRFVPKFLLNPPNLSIIVYSAGIIMISYFVFEMWNMSKKSFLLLAVLSSVFEYLGKYSLDIFLWHILLQKVLLKYAIIDSIWLKRIIFYLVQFSIPIFGKILYIRIKKDVSRVLAEEITKR